MPLYEYRCLKCGARFEKIVKFSDPPLTACEKCGGELEQLLSAPAIQFKGSGWYITD
ncbi:MAG: transcriptional regulator, partial [Acidobacteria bacterium]